MSRPVEGWTEVALPLLRRGKVRDVYDLGDHLLMVATDRLSAFDVVLPTPIPGKGAALTRLSRFWFERLRPLQPNHLVTTDLAEVPRLSASERACLSGRAMLVRRAERIDVECVVRGYLAGSAWTEYRTTGRVIGHAAPEGLTAGAALPTPLFTPAIKHDDGHDANVTVDELRARIGSELVERLEEASLTLYAQAAVYARSRGIVIADTKFEFGWIGGELTLIDEALTPDSSRFWDADALRSGTEPPSFDKQFVRDWLEESGWDKTPPGPELPPEVVAGAQRRYAEAVRRLTGEVMPPPNFGGPGGVDRGSTDDRGGGG